MSRASSSRIALDVSIRWGGDVIAARRLEGSATAELGDHPRSLARIEAPDLPASFTLASVDGRVARAFVPASAEAVHVRAEMARAISGAATIDLAVGDVVTITAGAFDLIVEASAREPKRMAPIGASALGGARAHVVAAALLQGIFLLSGHAAYASSLSAPPDDDGDAIRSYLAASEMASNRSDAPSRPDEEGHGRSTLVDGHDGDGKAGGGARAIGRDGAMGSPLSQSRRPYRYATPEAEGEGRSELDTPSLEDARAFGMIGLLSAASSVPIGWGDGAGASERDDLFAANGAMNAAMIGESFGAGGLGLTGIGEGGGGRGLGIGLGTIGTWGHGAGAPGEGAGGEGFGSVHGRKGLHWQHWTHSWQHTYSCGDSVSGRLPPETIQRVVRQNRGRFRACYEKGLVTNPSLAGRVTTAFVIGRDGAVSNAKNAGSDLADTGVVSCVTRAFYSLSFPQPDGGIVFVTYPWLFQPSE